MRRPGLGHWGWEHTWSGVVAWPDEFIECEAPVDHVGNATTRQELGYGVSSSVVWPTVM